MESLIGRFFFFFLDIEKAPSYRFSKVNNQNFRLDSRYLEKIKRKKNKSIH